jgi:hypothetical protein
LRSRRVQTTELGGEATSIAGEDPQLTIEDQMSVGDAMKDMQPLHGQALFFRAVEGLSHNEIAERLDMSPAQVKALLHRARTSFKKAWRNASGWSIAFMWHFRGRIKNGSLGGPHLIASAGPHVSLVAEGVVTSVVVVALALTGAQGVSGTGLGNDPSTSPRVAKVQGRSHHRVATSTASAASVAVADHTRSSGDEMHLAGSPEPQLVSQLSLPLQLIPAARARKGERAPAEKPDDRSEEQNPLPAPVRPVVKQVKEALEDLPPR